MYNNGDACSSYRFKIQVFGSGVNYTLWSSCPCDLQLGSGMSGCQDVCCTNRPK